MAPVPSLPDAWWTSGFNKISAYDQGRIVIGMAEPTDLAKTLRMKDIQQAKSDFSSTMGTDPFKAMPTKFGSGGTLSFKTMTSEFGSSETSGLIQVAKMVRSADGSDGPPSDIAIFATRAIPGIAFPGRGPVGFGRPRDDMEGAPLGTAPGRCSS